METSWTLLFFAWLAVTFLTAFVAGVIYLIYLPLKNWLFRAGRLTLFRSRLINAIYIVGMLVFTLYQTYFAVFPDLDFYADEYKTVTLRDIPKTAKFIAVKSSYPDFHGDYCSSSQIRLSKADYQILLNELLSDPQLVKTTAQVGFSEFDYTLGKGDKSENKIVLVLQRHIPKEEDHYLTISFYDDQQTIFVNICVT